MTNILTAVDSLSAVSAPPKEGYRPNLPLCPPVTKEKRYVFDLKTKKHRRQTYSKMHPDQSIFFDRDEKIHPSDLDFTKAARQAVLEKFAAAALCNQSLKASMQFRVVSPCGKMRLVNQVLTLLEPLSQTNHQVSIVETDLSQIATNPVKVVRIITEGDLDNSTTLSLSNFESDLDDCPFSDRQLQILSLLAEGCKTTEISESLFISADTVRTHRQHILQRSGHCNMTSTVVDCVRKGWI